MKRIIAVLGIVAIGTFAAFLLAPQRGAAPQAHFSTIAGEHFSTSELRGKVVVLNFWATWCAECVREMPQLVERQHRFSSRGLETVAVAVRDQHENVAAFSKRGALPFKVVLDSSGELSHTFGSIRVTPTTFVIDRKGRVLRRWVGEPKWDEFDRLVEKALAEPV